jgi:DNA (cytosine-5)-methyltransferase 1
MIYYNEIDRGAAAWLRELMDEGLIPEGVVDERPIECVQAADLRPFTQCHFFAGIGGWPFALRLAGWPNDLPVWTGSCPCQPFSSAGAGRGFDDRRHLWPEFFRLISECLPQTVFGEQVAAAIRHGWLDLVEGDLEEAGYAVGSQVFPAACVGAPHIRDRLYFVADSDRFRHAPRVAKPRRGAPGAGLERHFWAVAEWFQCPDGWKRARRPGSRLVADGVPGWLALLRGAGNAIVPQQAEAFIRDFVDACGGLDWIVPGLAIRSPWGSPDRQGRRSAIVGSGARKMSSGPRP